MMALDIQLLKCQLYFVYHEDYKKRVIQLGEDQDGL